MKTYQNFKYASLSILFVGIITIILLGCTHSDHSISRQMLSGILENDKIAVLFDTEPYSQSSALEKKIGKCISKAIKKLDKKVEIFPSKTFRQIAFEGIESESIKTTNQAVNSMLTNSSMLENIEGLGVHYLILFQSTTEKFKDTDNSRFWGVGGYGGGVFGYHASIHNQTHIYGEVYDISRRCRSGSIEARARGKEGAGAVFIIPYYWPAFDETLACEEFGNGVAEYLFGNTKLNN